MGRVPLARFDASGIGLRDWMKSSDQGICGSIIERIGNTPLIELRRVVPDDCARILLKIESENPTGSMKDRMALAMIETAEADGRLQPGGHVIEYTGGSTGVSLAFICAVKRYTASIVTSDAFSIEKRNQMKAFGAELTIIPSPEGKTTEGLTRAMIDAAREIAAETDGFWTDQLANPDQIAAYRKMGGEIWRQTDGRVDGFVAMTGHDGLLPGQRRSGSDDTIRRFTAWPLNRPSPRSYREDPVVPTRSRAPERGSSCLCGDRKRRTKSLLSPRRKRWRCAADSRQRKPSSRERQRAGMS